MKKIVLLILFWIFFSGNSVKAMNDDLQKLYLSGGYSEVHSAIRESEDFFKQEIALPTRIPSIPFTHLFGRFSTLGYPELEITFLNESSGTTHYKIYITPSEHKLIFSNTDKIEEAKLSDETKAIYYNNENFNLLIFEKNNFQYRLMVDEQSSEIVIKEVLLRIADSIQ